jgi:hypothetical protein
MSRVKTLMVASSAFVLGCGVAAVVPLMVPPARAGAPGPRWEYYCQSDMRRPWEEEDLAKLNKIGSEGWEMVQQLVGIQGTNGDVFCFKRQLP